MRRSLGVGFREDRTMAMWEVSLFAFIAMKPPIRSRPLFGLSFEPQQKSGWSRRLRVRSVPEFARATNNRKRGLRLQQRRGRVKIWNWPKHISHPKIT